MLEWVHVPKLARLNEHSRKRQCARQLQKKKECKSGDGGEEVRRDGGTQKESPLLPRIAQTFAHLITGTTCTQTKGKWTKSMLSKIASTGGATLFLYPEDS
jgi:hypothetical protein